MAPHPRKHRSLFGEILDWMLAPLLLLWPLSVLLTWLVAQGLANQPFDRELGGKVRQLAQEVELRPATGNRMEANLRPTGLWRQFRSTDADVASYQVLGSRGERLAGDSSIPSPADEEHAPAGEVRFRDETIGKTDVRVGYMWVPGSERGAGLTPLVQVAETLDKRSRLATEIIKGVILPQFVILPVAVLLVWLALARGIAPLNELQQRIRRRDSSDLSPIDEHAAPEEVSPLVRAINDLLERLDQSIKAQKHFLADAAHQLKTPLAGLRTQAELAQRQIDAGQHDPKALKESLQQIARSSQNAAHMVNQLLAMARAEDEEQGAHREAVNLPMLATGTVRDFVPRAFDKHIDLGYEGPDNEDALAGTKAIWVRGNLILLREMLRNLIDNALQYTPADGTVTVRMMADPFGQVVVLQVEDSGPGIAPAEREQVFHPFYRSLGTNVDGSGLGLAIVREIATRHRVEITLDDAQPRTRNTTAAGSGPGALFTLRFVAISQPMPEIPAVHDTGTGFGASPVDAVRSAA
ncbi:MAG: sensor histidine kinase N-terminal domain-containing protein [Caldimonas sp.]